MSTATAPVSATATNARVAVTRKRRGANRRLVWIGWLFMLPLVISNLAVIVVPAIEAVYYSFTSWSGIGSARFIGLANYTRMLEDKEFLNALGNNIVWTVISLILPMVLGLGGAYLLSRMRRLQLLFRVVFFIPYIVATVVSAAIWKNLFSPDTGIGALLGVNFLGSKALALPSVAVVNTWAFWGFLAVVFLAAMQAVNPALYEAAALDGAGPFRQFISITIPNIRPTLVFLTVQSVIWSFLAFDYIYILTNGGPAGSTDVLSTLLYRNAFSNLEAGYASALGVVMAIVSAVVVGTYQVLRRVRRWDV